MSAVIDKSHEARLALQALNDLEWRIIEAARTDGALSLNPEGMIARLLRGLGVAIPHGLGSEKLEALRRFSVRAWNWDWLRRKDLQALYEAGYSNFHVLEILSHIGAARGFTPSVIGEPAPPIRKHSSHQPG